MPTHQGFLPEISVIKPLCGLDREDYTNLASFCQQIYPNYQIIFGVKDKADSCVEIVDQLIRDFPQLDIQLVICDASIGVNQKVNNLANAAAHAKYPIWVLADSDVWVGPSYLQHIVQPMQDSNVGAVTCLYRPVAKGWVAGFEAIGISTDYLASVLVAHRLEGLRFTLGPTVVLRRSAFDAVGGFSAIADYLADDFQIGFLLAQAKYKVVLSDYVIDHLMTTNSFRDLWQRQIRWHLCTRVSRPWGYLGLLFTHGTVMGLMLLVLTSFAGPALGLCGIVLGLRLWMAWTVGVQILDEPVAKGALWLVPLRDVMSFVLWFCGLFTGRIQWRGKGYKVARGGKLVLTQMTKSSLQKQKTSPIFIGK